MSLSALSRAELLDFASGFDPSVILDAAGFQPDEWQRRVLRSTAKKQIIVGGRQTGKSVVGAAAVAQNLLHSPGSLSIVLAPSLKQAGETARKIAGIIDTVGAPLDTISRTALGIELSNGARSLCVPSSETSVRGYAAPELLLIDEAAAVDVEVVRASLPVLAASENGRLLLISSARGRRNWFAEVWFDGGDDWERFEARASDCARISRDFLEGERRIMGDRLYEQEYECAFLDDSLELDARNPRVFNPDLLRGLVDPSIQPITI